MATIIRKEEFCEMCCFLYVVENKSCNGNSQREFNMVNLIPDCKVCIALAWGTTQSFVCENNSPLFKKKESMQNVHLEKIFTF